MNNKAKTLIIVPVYNAQEFLVRTLESCVAQTVFTEVWVVDNCSTDCSQKIAQEYAQRNERVTLIVNEKNYGRVGNWNRCLDLFMESEYQYIKFVFAGDEIFKDCINQAENAFKIDPEIGAVAFPYEFVDLKGNISISEHKHYYNQLFDSKTITRINLAEGMLLGAIICNVYAKKSIAQHRFDENAISKVQFDIRVLENFKAYYLGKTLARFNLDSHRTFSKADSSLVHMEFSFIEVKELNRIAQKGKFIKKEIDDIEQRIIENCVRNQYKYMKTCTILRLIKFLLTGFIKQKIKRMLPFGKQIRKLINQGQ